MPEWQRQLVHHLHANYGHESPSSALSAKRKGDMGEFQQILWSNLQKAFKLTKTGGRPSNHQRAVRDVLLTVLAADVPIRLHYLGNPMVGANDMRKFVSRLSSLVGGTESATVLRGEGQRAVGQDQRRERDSSPVTLAVLRCGVAEQEGYH